MDPDFYKNLAWMLENDIEGVLDLTFTEESDYFGRTELVELKPEGANTKVTDANKRECVPYLTCCHVAWLQHLHWPV